MPGDGTLTIGTPVYVRRVLVKGRLEGGDPIWEAYTVNQMAVVTGYGQRCEGQFQKATGGGGSSLFGEAYDGGDYEPAYLAVTRRFTVVFVRFALWGKEYPTLPEHLDLPAEGNTWTLPRRQAVRPIYTEVDPV